MTSRLSCVSVILLLTLPGACAHAQVAAGAAETSSGVRIVRLSQVQGKVSLDRNTDRGFEQAFANLPIIQGQRLQTAEGLAEVEFEDNSTLRLAPASNLAFPTLGRSALGVTTSRVNLQKGTLYVSLEKTRGNEFTVATGNTTVTLSPGTHIRLESGASQAKLSVFSGDVSVAGPSGIIPLARKKVITFPLTGDTPAVIAGNIEPGPFDDWDKTAAGYHRSGSFTSAYASSGSAYGLNDMNYYGGFSNVGGCGSMWRPYLANAAFDPYANGIWAWYPQAGYSWVSPYPWGWTAFHSGSWDFCPAGGGWGWRPNGGWRGLINHPQPLNPTRTPLRGTGVPRPPNPPMPGQPTFSVVSTHPLSVSRMTSPENFEIRRDSAGLGVPRGTFTLSKISSDLDRHTDRPSVTRSVNVESQAAVNPSSSSFAPGATPRTGVSSWSDPAHSSNATSHSNAGSFPGGSSPALQSSGAAAQPSSGSAHGK